MLMPLLMSVPVPMTIVMVDVVKAVTANTFRLGIHKRGWVALISAQERKMLSSLFSNQRAVFLFNFTFFLRLGWWVKRQEEGTNKAEEGRRESLGRGAWPEAHPPTLKH